MPQGPTQSVCCIPNPTMKVKEIPCPLEPGSRGQNSSVKCKEEYYPSPTLTKQQKSLNTFINLPSVGNGMVCDISTLERNGNLIRLENSMMGTLKNVIENPGMIYV